MLCNFDQFWIYDFRKQSEEHDGAVAGRVVADAEYD